MHYQPNQGSLPDECLIRDEQGEVTGHRTVHVRLFGGIDTKARGDPPWPSAGARVPTRWKISRKPHPFEIKEWTLA